MENDKKRTAPPKKTAEKKLVGGPVAGTCEERLDALGFGNLKDASPEIIEETIRLWAQDYMSIESRLTRDLYLDLTARKLKGVVDSPKKMLRNAVAEIRPTDEEHTVDGGTRPAGVIDLLRDGDKKTWLITAPDGPEVVDEVEGADEWPLGKLMEVWTLPEEELVATHLTQESDSCELWESVKQWIKGAVVLPAPQDGWADLLTAWILGSHLHQRFNYYPMLYLPGEPERGKTRLGKAIIYLSFRGHYSPSLTPATLFRWADWHKITLMLDVGSITTVLERGDMLDLILNRFERDGRISRAIHPDKRPSEQVESFGVYGPTILLTNEQLRRAHGNVRSRCIEVMMPEAGHIEVPDAVTPEDAKDLFARTVAWAAENHTTALPQVEMPFRGRLTDLAKPILQMAELANREALEPIIEVLRTQDRERRVDTAESWEARVAIALWASCKEILKEGQRVYISDLTTVVNRDRPIEEHLTPQRVGMMKKKLGLSGGYGGTGSTAYITWPGDGAVKALYSRYSTDEPSGSSGPSVTPEAQGRSGQETCASTPPGPPKASRPENPRPVKSAEDPDHTEDLPTYMSQLDVPAEDKQEQEGFFDSEYEDIERMALQDETTH